jgi:hypothetical protein
MIAKYKGAVVELNRIETNAKRVYGQVMSAREPKEPEVTDALNEIRKAERHLREARRHLESVKPAKNVNRGS